jgi:LPXTG-motif cell wall-anchored protein
VRERLYRSRHDRVIGGLAAGLARNLGVDVTWVRLGWVVLAFLTQGVAILIYVVLLFVIPEEPEGLAPETEPAEERPDAVPGWRAPSGGAGDATSGGGSAAGMAEDPTQTGPSDAPPPGTVRPPSSTLERWVGGARGPTAGDSSRTAALVVGLVLVGAGAWLLLRRYVLINFELGWPVIAIILGVILILAAMRTGQRR